MKKLFIITAILFATVTTANAQWFIGGRAYYSESFLKNDYLYTSNVNNYKIFTRRYSISPRVGYSINNRFDVGIDLGYLSVTEVNETRYLMRTAESSFFVAPYVRYYIWQYKKVALSIEAQFSVRFGDLKGVDFREVEVVGNTVAYRASIVPVFSWNITDHIALEVQIDILSLNYYNEKATIEYKGYIGDLLDRAIIRQEQFYVGANPNSMFSLNGLTIGCCYKF